MTKMTPCYFRQSWAFSPRLGRTKSYDDSLPHFLAAAFAFVQLHVHSYLLQNMGRINFKPSLWTQLEQICQVVNTVMVSETKTFIRNANSEQIINDCYLYAAGPDMSLQDQLNHQKFVMLLGLCLTYSSSTRSGFFLTPQIILY